MHVLVVEDDAAVRHLMRRALDREGFAVVEAGDGAEALRASERERFQVAIVDIGLPDMSGLELIDGLRRLFDDLHVIIVSGAGSEVERVRGIVAGADDYMVKPVSLRELAARVVAVERRRSPRGGAVPSERERALVVRFGTIVVDVHARRVTDGGRPIDLTRREFDLLSYLTLHPGVSMSRERLLEVVWSSSATWQSPSTVTEHVRRLRSKIEVDAAKPRWLTTVRGVGYRFDPDPATAPDQEAGHGQDAAPAPGTTAAPAAIDGVPTGRVGPGNGSAQEQRALDDDLRRGLAEDEFEVHYLPVLDLAERRVLAVEALVRWQHPERGLLEPSAFLDAAERSGLMIDLGIHVMDAACRQLRVWRQAGHDLHVAVNVSARQLADVALPERIESLMVANAVPVGSLWLEVSEETLAVEPDVASSVLERTEMLGACMVIDDFGAGGGASLAQLQRFPIHALKIDRTFVDDLDTNPSSRAIARSIVSLGRDLGVVVIAEGIETRAQLERLRSMGCRFGQGYLFGRPEPAERLAIDPSP